MKNNCGTESVQAAGNGACIFCFAKRIRRGKSVLLIYRFMKKQERADAFADGQGRNG